MKSLARDGDSDVGCRIVLMTKTLRPTTDSERNTIEPDTYATGHLHSEGNP
jgi:hypothetical protein